MTSRYNNYTKNVLEGHTQMPNVELEALDLERKFKHFERALIYIFWSDILERFDKTRNNVQSENLNILAGTK